MEQAIRSATSDADFEAFAALITGYVAWCRDRCADDPGFVDRVFGHQALDVELRNLRALYDAPHGTTRLVVHDLRGVAGGGALRWLDDGSAEMKRVFVAPGAAGRGIGRRLCEALIDAARTQGCPVIRIDTASRFHEALALYESLGFRRCAPHRDYPPDIRSHLVFMALPLGR